MRNPACFSETCAAPTLVPLRSGLLDKLARKVSHGTLKGRACRREVERLFVASALREIVHLIQNRRRIAVLQLQVERSTVQSGCLRNTLVR